MDDKIFVEIAAYRDLELVSTIESAMENADHPEKLTFGIVHQYGPETANMLEQYRCKRAFRTVEMSFEDCRGVGEARALSEMLYRGEEWRLRIDAHMIFGKHWDTIIKKQWFYCNDKKAVLSSYPPLYEYGKNGEIEFDKMFRPGYMVEIIKASEKCEPQRNIVIVPESERHKMVVTRYIAGGLEFSKGELLNEVKYIKEIVFCGEETARSVQLYTHGYNVYAPIGLPIFHRYIREGAHRYWVDMRDSENAKRIYNEISGKSASTIRDMMTKKTSAYYGDTREAADMIDGLNTDAWGIDVVTAVVVVTEIVTVVVKVTSKVAATRDKIENIAGSNMKLVEC